MPYIKYASAPASIGTGREARYAAVHPDTGVWIAEVDVAVAGENVTDAKEHAATVSAAEAYALANHPQDIETPPPMPSPLESMSERIDQIVALNKLIDADVVPPMEARG